MGNFKFGDHSTKDFDLVIQTPPTYTFPEKDITTTHIPGRNGDVITDNDSYKNIERTYSVASVFRPGTDFVANAERIIEWLTKYTGYVRLEDTYDDTVYRMATYKNGGSLVNLYDRATAIDVSFDCKPQRYLKIGEKPIDFVSSDIKLRNPTSMPSLPIIKLDNLKIDNEFTYMLSVKNYKNEVVSLITLNNLSNSNLVIDSENQTVYTTKNGNTINAANFLSLNGLEFPKFYRENNQILIKNYSQYKKTVDKYSDLIDNNKETCFALYKPYDTLIEAAQQTARITSYSDLIDTTKETYNVEAYSNLCKAQAVSISIPSFNTVLDNINTTIQFNSNKFIYTGHTDGSHNTLCFKNEDNSISIGENSIKNGIIYDFNNYRLLLIRTRTVEGFLTNKQNRSYNYLYLLKNNNDTNDSTPEGFFVLFDDITDDNYSNHTIKYVPAVDLNLFYREDITDPLDKDEFYEYLYDALVTQDFNDVGKYKFSDLENANLFDILDIDSSLIGQNHTIVLSLYKAKLVSYTDGDGNEKTKPELDFEYEMSDDIKDIIKTEVSYIEDKNYQVDSVSYTVAKAGYFYNNSDSGSILNTITGKLGTLLNSSGWNFADEGKKIDGAEWDDNKRAFVYGSLLSKKTDTTIDRQYFSEDNLPNYEDEVLDGTYETDADGNYITDTAGNKTTKTILHRFEVVEIGPKMKNITKIKYLYDGFYKWNYDTTWKYRAKDTIEIIDIKTTKAYTLSYLKEVPSYATEKDYPKWLNPMPVFYKGDGSEIEGSDNKANQDKINSTYYDFIVEQNGYYRYNYESKSGNGIQILNTEFAYRIINDELGVINPQTEKRKVTEGTTVNYIESQDSETFPIALFEFGRSIEFNSGALTGKYNIVINSKEKTTLYDSTKTYSKNDYVLQSTSYSGTSIDEKKSICHSNVLYKCLEDNVTGNWDESKWKLLGLYINVAAFNSEKAYVKDEYAIYDKKIYITSVNQNPKEWDGAGWVLLGDYIKNIGFYYLNNLGKEDTLKFNLPADWVRVEIQNGTKEDYSDSKMLYYTNATGYYKWDSNTEWKKYSEVKDTDELTSADYKVDTRLYYLSNLPQYDVDDTFEFVIDESTTGNPISVTTKAKKDGYYRINTSLNYEYHNKNDILLNINIYNTFNLIYLEENNNSENVNISIIPRWWKL